MRLQGGAVLFPDVEFAGGGVTFPAAIIRGTVISVTTPTFSGGVLDFSTAADLHGDVEFDGEMVRAAGLCFPRETERGSSRPARKAEGSIVQLA
jgi:hypothetical protein